MTLKKIRRWNHVDLLPSTTFFPVSCEFSVHLNSRNLGIFFSPGIALARKLDLYYSFFFFSILFFRFLSDRNCSVSSESRSQWGHLNFQIWGNTAPSIIANKSISYHSLAIAAFRSPFSLSPSLLIPSNIQSLRNFSFS